MASPAVPVPYIPYVHLVQHLQKFPDLQYFNVRCEFAHIKMIFEMNPSIQLDWNLYEYHRYTIRLVKKDMLEPWFKNVIDDNYVSKHDPGHWLPEYGWEESTHPNDLSIEEWRALAIKYFHIRQNRGFYMVYHPKPCSVLFKKEISMLYNEPKQTPFFLKNSV